MQLAHVPPYLVHQLAAHRSLPARSARAPVPAKGADPGFGLLWSALREGCLSAIDTPSGVSMCHRPPSEGPALVVGATVRVVDPGFDRHLRVSIRVSSALVGNGAGGSAGLAARVVDPGFDRHLRVSIRVSSALVGNGVGGSAGLAARVVDPGVDRHRRVSIRVWSALVGNGAGGSAGLAARVVDPGFDRELGVSIRVSSALVGNGAGGSAGLAARVVDPGVDRHRRVSIRVSSALAWAWARAMSVGELMSVCLSAARWTGRGHAGRAGGA